MSARQPFTKAEQEESRKKLRKMLKPGDTVQVVQRHVSRSGMMRHLSLFVVRNNQLIDITWDAAAAMGDRVYDDYHWTLHVGGAGMDMHFATVYGLSRALYPDGHKCTGNDGSKSGTRRCPSNDHSNDYNTASWDFDQVLKLSGKERLYGYQTDAEKAQHEERREYMEKRLATDLGYRKDRVHSDGGYALNHRTI